LIFQLCREYLITGYPTIVLFEKDNYEVFLGERSAASISAFALSTTPSKPFVPGAVDAPAPAPPALSNQHDSRVRRLIR
jgi:hypothetical protein